MNSSGATILLLTFLTIFMVVVKCEDDTFPTPLPLESFVPRVKRQFVVGGYPGYGAYPYGYGGYGVMPYGGYWG